MKLKDLNQDIWLDLPEADKKIYSKKIISAMSPQAQRTLKKFQENALDAMPEMMKPMMAVIGFFRIIELDSSEENRALCRAIGTRCLDPEMELDLNVPFLDTVSLTQELQRLPALSPVTVIVTTDDAKYHCSVELVSHINGETRIHCTAISSTASS